MTRAEFYKLVELSRQARELTFQVSDQLFAAKAAQASKKFDNVPDIEIVKEMAANLHDTALRIKNHLSNETTLRVG